MKIQHHLVSPFILCQREAGISAGRLDGVALFVDIAGFSTITSKLMEEGQNGAEALAVLMRAIYEPLVDAVYAQGGFITFFAGDAFTALFPTEGTPWQLEPPIAPPKQRALAAAWAIRAHMVENSRIETPYASFDLGVKLGMAAGAVDWGIIAAEDEARAAAYFRGPSIDASAAAEKFAGHNDLILAPAVREELADLVTGEPVEDHFRVRAVTQELPDQTALRSFDGAL